MVRAHLRNESFMRAVFRATFKKTDMANANLSGGVCNEYLHMKSTVITHLTPSKWPYLNPCLKR